MGWTAVFAAMGVADDIYTGQKQHDAEFHQAVHNREMAESAAGEVLAQARTREELVRRQGDKVIAAQKVAYSASGVDATVGTAKQVQDETRAITETDAQTLENNAARQAWGFHQHGIEFMQNANLGKVAISGRIGKSMINAASTVANSYATGEKADQ